MKIIKALIAGSLLLSFASAADAVPVLVAVPAPVIYTAPYPTYYDPYHSNRDYRYWHDRRIEHRDDVRDYNHDVREYNRDVRQGNAEDLRHDRREIREDKRDLRRY